MLGTKLRGLVKVDAVADLSAAKVDGHLVKIEENFIKWSEDFFVIINTISEILR